jgi:hypothetical protein
MYVVSHEFFLCMRVAKGKKLRGRFGRFDRCFYPGLVFLFPDPISTSTDSQWPPSIVCPSYPFPTPPLPRSYSPPRAASRCRTQLQWLTVTKSHCDLPLLNALWLRSNRYGWSKSRSQNSNCSEKFEKILVRFTWLTMDSMKLMFHFDERNYD